jgi:hypothetical protein
MKSATRFSKASGSDRRRVEDLIHRRGRYSPKAIVRREGRRRKGGSE